MTVDYKKMTEILGELKVLAGFSFIDDRCFFCEQKIRRGDRLYFCLNPHNKQMEYMCVACSNLCKQVIAEERKEEMRKKNDREQ